MAEQHLRTLLEDAAANVPAPNMVAAALAGARRRQMRRRMTVAVAVTAAGVVLGAVAITSPDLSGGEKPAPAGPITKSQDPAPSLLPPSPSVQLPKTVADLPEGDAPAWPYTIADTLFVGGVSTSLEEGSVWLRVGGDSAKPGPGGSSTMTWTPGEAASPILLLRADGLDTTALDDDASSGPVVSVDGRLAAWQTSSSGPAEAVVWDLLASREVARKRFPFTPSCCDNPFNVVGIDAAGRVFADGGGQTWVWDTGTGSLQVVRGLGRTGYVTEATTAGVVVTLDPRSKEDSPVALVGKVNGDGRFVEQVRVDGVAGTVSWDGSRFAYVVGGESLRVRDLATGDERVMKLPTATYVTDLIWETSKSLLVVVESADKGPDAWVRCYSDTGACELAVVLRGSYGVASR